MNNNELHTWRIELSINELWAWNEQISRLNSFCSTKMDIELEWFQWLNGRFSSYVGTYTSNRLYIKIQYNDKLPQMCAMWLAPVNQSNKAIASLVSVPFTAYLVRINSTEIAANSFDFFSTSTANMKFEYVWTKKKVRK